MRGSFAALGAVACGVVDGTTDERVTEDAFDDAYKDRYCEEWHTCGGAGMCPFEQPTEYNNFGPVLPADCEFDADAAEECLEGPWTCNSDVPGFETPIVPTVCEEVCV